MLGISQHETGIYQFGDRPLQIHEIDIISFQQEVVDLSLRQRKGDSVEHIQHKKLIVECQLIVIHA